MPAPLRTLNTTAMTARMAPLLAKINLVPAIVTTVILLTMISPDLLLQLTQTQQSNYRSVSMSAVDLCLSTTTIPWLKLRTYWAEDLLAGYYRILD